MHIFSQLQLLIFLGFMPDLKYMLWAFNALKISISENKK